MRYRLIDRIDRLEPWRKIRGRLCVSLEAYNLLKPLGRSGVLPECLLLEATAQLGRWLVTVSSEYTLGTQLFSVHNFALSPVGMGATLGLELNVIERAEDRLTLCCRGEVEGEEVLTGQLILTLTLLAEEEDPDRVALLGKALHATP